MTQSFDEWFKEEKSEYPLKLDAVSCRKGYKAGAQSRQAEIDELQKRIDEALEAFEDYCQSILKRRKK